MTESRKKRLSFGFSLKDNAAGASVASAGLRANDDEAEKKRRKSGAGLNHSGEVSENASGSSNGSSSSSMKKSRQSIGGQNKRMSAAFNRRQPQISLSTPQLVDLYSNCIKLSTENKINQKNTWDLNLIDYIDDILETQHNEGDLTNFQAASCTLDASVKIYASRVDSVHTEAYKVLGGMTRTGLKDNKDDDNVGGADPSRQRKKATSGTGNTLATDWDALNGRKFDLEFAVDPLFHKTSAAFDEGGARGLLLNHLDLGLGGELVFDSDTIPRPVVAKKNDEASGVAEEDAVVEEGTAEKEKIADGEKKDAAMEEEEVLNDDDVPPLEEGGESVEMSFDIDLIMETTLPGLTATSMREMPLCPAFRDFLFCDPKMAFLDGSSDDAAAAAALAASKRATRSKANLDDSFAIDDGNFEHDSLSHKTDGGVDDDIFKHSIFGNVDNDDNADDNDDDDDDDDDDDNDGDFDFGGFGMDDDGGIDGLLQDEDNVLDAERDLKHSLEEQMEFGADESEPPSPGGGGGGVDAGNAFGDFWGSASHDVANDGNGGAGDGSGFDSMSRAAMSHLSLAAEGDEYNFLDTTKMMSKGGWMGGPGHWKLHNKGSAAGSSKNAEGDSGEASAAPASIKAKKGRAKKDAFFLSFLAPADFSYDSQFQKPGRASTTLSKAVLAKARACDNTLPPDIHYGVRDLTRLFLRPDCTAARMRRRYRAAACSSFAGGEGEGFEFSSDIYGDGGDDDDDDNDDGLGYGDFDAGDGIAFGDDSGRVTPPHLLSQQEEGSLIALPKMVEHVDIKYAKTAKKVDVRGLKQTIWSQLCKPEVEKDSAGKVEEGGKGEEEEEEEEVHGVKQFQDVLDEIAVKLPAQQAKQVSVPFCFICLLHLANEKRLDITGDGTMDSLTINQKV